MGRASFTFQRNVNDNTRWQDFITKLHNAMIAAGLEYIPIVGDLDLASNKPANNAMPGSRLYAFTDPDQAANEVYVRISPMVTRAADIPYFAFETGFAYNPTTGAITGNKSENLYTSGLSVQPTDGDATTRICHGDGYLHILHNVSTQTRSNCALAAIERPLTSDGNSNRGVLAAHFAVVSNGTRAQVVPRVGTPPGVQNNSGNMFSGSVFQSSDGGAPWSWTNDGVNDVTLMPTAMYPALGDLAVSRVLYAPNVKISSDQVIGVGPTGSKIPHYWAGDIGLYINDSNNGVAIRWEE